MKKVFLFLSALFFLSGCDMLEEDEKSEYGKIFFRPEHLINIETGEIKNGLHLYTEKFYGSGGVMLNIESKPLSNGIQFHITGITEPEVAPAVLAPAHAYVDVEEYTGTRLLVLSGDNFRDFYIMTITDSLISIDGPSTSNTEPVLRCLETGVNIRK